VTDTRIALTFEAGREITIPDADVSVQFALTEDWLNDNEAAAVRNLALALQKSFATQSAMWRQGERDAIQ
jgi:hypothetical protein